MWEAAFEAEGVDPKTYLGTIPVTARLPWDHISVGLEEGFLAREYRKAVASRLSPPCGKAAGAFLHATNLDDAEKDSRKLVCYDCGVACDLSAMRQERIVYLDRLGAKQRVNAKPLPPVAEKKAPPPRIVQGEPRRYRFAYTKLGPSAFLSHLDLIRALPRAFRRLDLPLYYSSGYHPKPEMAFGPALSLGVASLGEMIDVKVTADFDPAAIAAQLGDGAPDGIDFLGGVALGPEDASITRVIDSARYLVAIARSVLADRGGEAWLAGEVDRLRASSEHTVTRRIEGIGKSVDVRSFLRGLTLGGDEGHALMARAGLVGDLVPLLVDVEIRGSGSVKITEVVEALAGAELPHRAVRVALGTWVEGAIASPLDLAAVRRPRKIVVESESVVEPGPAAGA